MDIRGNYPLLTIIKYQNDHQYSLNKRGLAFLTHIFGSNNMVPLVLGDYLIACEFTHKRGKHTLEDEEAQLQPVRGNHKDPWPHI